MMAGYQDLRFIPGVGGAVADIVEMQKNQLPIPEGASIPRIVGTGAREWANQVARNAVRTGQTIAGAATYLPKELYAGFTGQPAETQNAVATTANMGGTSTTKGQVYNQGDLRNLEAPPDPNAFKAPNAAAAEENYGAYKTREAARVAQAAQPATYPGAPTDISKQIASTGSAGIDFGLPRMGYQPAATAVNTGGLFPPGLMSSIQQYHDLAAKADDGSLAGAWRSRGYAKQRDRLLAGAVNAATADAAAITAGAHTTTANAAMMRAVNEPALEGMKNYITARGQDLTYGLGMQQDLTHRYGYDVSRANALDTVAAHRYGSELTAGVHKYAADIEREKALPDIQRKDLALQAFQAGHTDEANVLFGHPQQERYTQAGGPLEGGVRVLDQRTGKFTYIPTKDLPKFATTPESVRKAREKHIEDVAAGR